MERFKTAAPLEIAIAVVAGACSACLIYLLANALLWAVFGITLYSRSIKLSLFLEAWGFSTILLLKLSRTLTELLGRSFLLGAVEWLTVALAGIFLFDGRPLLAAGMSLGCLLGFGVTQLWYVQRQRAAKYTPAEIPPT